MEFHLSYFKSWKMMLWKCNTQYASKFGKLSSGHRTGKDQFSFQSQRKAMPKNAQVQYSSVAHSRPTLCDPMDYNLLGFSIHGILQARILDWIAISFSRGSSWPRDRIRVSCIGRWILHHWTTREDLHLWEIFQIIQNSKTTRLYVCETSFSYHRPLDI